MLIVRFVQYLKKRYPLKGRPLSAYPARTKYFIVLLSLVAFIAAAYSMQQVTPVPIEWPRFWIFLTVTSIFGFITNWFSFEGNPQSVLLDITSFVNLWAVVLFQNYLAVLIQLLVHSFINGVFGLRRPHAVAFNISMRVLETLPVFLLYMSFPWFSEPMTVILSSLLFAVIVTLVNFLLLMTIVVLSSGMKMRDYISQYGNYLGTFYSLAVTAVTLVLVQLLADAYVFIIILLTVVNVVETRNLKLREDNLEKERRLREIGKERLKQEFENEKYRSLSVFIGGIAHDFNNILTAIAGNAELLQLKSVETEVDEIVKAAHKAKEIVAQLMTYTRMPQGHADVINITPEILETAKLMLSGTATALFSGLDDTLFVNISRGNISQIVSNLVLNASQAMNGEGEVVILSEKLELSVDNPYELPPGRYVRLSVMDSGVGISDEDAGRIFDPYFTTKSDGKGLGLVSVKNIVESVGGHIYFTSKQDVGTTFNVILPLANQMKKEGTREENPSKLSGRLLVLDDQPAVLEVFGKMLRSFGDIHVDLVSDGLECVELFKESLAHAPYDLLILDRTVTGGYGAIKVLHEISSMTDNLRWVLTSGYIDSSSFELYENLGHMEFLPKPFTTGQLREVVGRFLEAGR